MLPGPDHPDTCLLIKSSSCKIQKPPEANLSENKRRGFILRVQDSWFYPLSSQKLHHTLLGWKHIIIIHTLLMENINWPRKSLQPDQSGFSAPLIIFEFKELRITSNPICMYFQLALLGLIRWIFYFLKGRNWKVFLGKKYRGSIGNLDGEVCSSHDPV